MVELKAHWYYRGTPRHFVFTRLFDYYKRAEGREDWLIMAPAAPGFKAFSLLITPLNRVLFNIPELV